MHNYKVFLIAVALLIFAKDISGQKLPVKLQWTDNIVTETEDFSFEALHFIGAEYNDSLYVMPELRIVEELPAGSYFADVQVDIRNATTQQLSEHDKNIIGKDRVFSSDFKIETHIKTTRGKQYLVILINPFRRTNRAAIQKLISCDIYYKGVQGRKPAGHLVEKYSANSVLASGKWIKVPIRQSGVYRVSYSQLREMGIEQPERVRVFGNDAGMLSMLNDGTAPFDLLENKIIDNGSEILFFAKGPNTWSYSETDKRFRHRDHLYDDAVYYYFSSDYNSGNDNIMETLNSVPAAADFIVDYFNDFQRINKHDINIAKTGRIFYGDAFDIVLSRNYQFEFPNLRTDMPVHFAVSLAAAAGSVSYFTAEVGSYSENISVPSLINYFDARTAYKEFTINSHQSDLIELSLSYGQLSPSWRGWLDYIEVNAARSLRWTGAQMAFRNIETIGEGQISEFVISNAKDELRVWDITNPVQPIQIETSLTANEMRFKLPTESLREFVVFESGTYLSLNTNDAEFVENQNLHALSPNTDMVIVSHHLFYNQAQEIKTMREQEGLSVFLTTPEKIYNEFSSGAADISAIRNFMKMLYDKAASPEQAVRYLLLFGNGSYDNKGEFEGNTNYILTYQSTNSVGQTQSYFSDDYYTLLDAGEGDIGNRLQGLPDIGVGRIPVDTRQQANDYLRKLKQYANPATYESWRNHLVFVADDGDSNAHIRDADTLAITIDKDYPWFNISKLYFDSYRQETSTGGVRYPRVTTDLNNAVSNGSLLINYTGHGGVRGWAHERVLTIRDVENWRNFDRLALFVTATCEFARFDDYSFRSAGQRAFLNPNGGAIAMFTTARLAYIHSNAALTKAFYNNVFEPSDGNHVMRLGDVIRRTKIQRGGAANDLIFFLLGDPSMRLGIAEHNVITESINGQNIEQFSDTIKALSKVKFSGRLEDKSGQKLNDFSGIVYPTVYDKEQTVNTLDNNNDGAWTYRERSNIIFRGQASVKNGEFDFEFIVPRDIFLNIGNGKLSYYAAGGQTTAKGADERFLIGGVADNYDEDTEGPEINIYMNDENFVSGGITDSNPILLAKFWDESGINTASGAIGHDITAVLNEDMQTTLFLNNYYVADTDSYQSGQLRYYLFDIEEGSHEIKIKAWDVYNNSSEKTLDFVVINQEDLVLKRLLNYPNPFTTATNFYFEHNRAFDQLDVLIQVFTPSGRPVKTIRETINSQAYRAGPFFWDGTDDFGQRIGRGAYIYRVKIRSSDGKEQEEYQKLLILQ